MHKLEIEGFAKLFLRMFFLISPASPTCEITKIVPVRIRAPKRQWCAIGHDNCHIIGRLTSLLTMAACRLEAWQLSLIVDYVGIETLLLLSQCGRNQRMFPVDTVPNAKKLVEEKEP